MNWHWIADAFLVGYFISDLTRDVVKLVRLERRLRRLRKDGAS